MNVEVRDNPRAYRYEVWADGELAGYTQYALLRGRIAFLHTKIYESYGAWAWLAGWPERPSPMRASGDCW
jgi:hypothetical protein